MFFVVVQICKCTFQEHLHLCYFVVWEMGVTSLEQFLKLFPFFRDGETELNVCKH